MRGQWGRHLKRLTDDDLADADPDDDRRSSGQDAGRYRGPDPDELLKTFSAEQAGLDARGIPDGVAQPGDSLGDFDLLDVHGEPTTLSRELRGRTAVVVLYRGAWCPYCNLALRAYQDDLVPTLDDKGIALVAISPQKPDGSLSAQEKNELASPFCPTRVTRSLHDSA